MGLTGFVLTISRAFIGDLVARLEHLHERITACRVTVEGPPAHHHKGGCFSVRIALAVPGGEINVNSGETRPGHADVYVALRDAIDGARRQLVNFDRERGHQAASRRHRT